MAVREARDLNENLIAGLEVRRKRGRDTLAHDQEQVGQTVTFENRGARGVTDVEQPCKRLGVRGQRRDLNINGGGDLRGEIRAAKRLESGHR